MSKDPTVALQCPLWRALFSTDTQRGNPPELPCILAKQCRKMTAVQGEVFNLPDHFSITGQLGHGAYATVVEAMDLQSAERVAVKKCGKLFARPEDGKRILREIKLMRGLRHANILSLRDVLVPVERQFEDVYIVTDRLDTDLYHLMDKATLSEEQIKSLLYQVLLGLKYMHSAHVMHRDMKPDNILLDFMNGVVKICDFNLARGAPNTSEGVPAINNNNTQPNNIQLTTGVATRWYRAPEILLENRKYGPEVDIWSLGCIFGEMYTKKTLFPGDTQLHMIELLTKSVPMSQHLPDYDWIETLDAKDYVLQSASQNNNRSSLHQLCPTICAQGLDMLQKMLAFHPSDRSTVDQLLVHPFLADYHNSKCCVQSPNVFKWKWDNIKPSEPTLRQLFWREVAQLHPKECDCILNDKPLPPKQLPTNPTTAATVVTTTGVGRPHYNGLLAPSSLPTTTKDAIEVQLSVNRIARPQQQPLLEVEHNLPPPPAAVTPSLLPPAHTLPRAPHLPPARLVATPPTLPLDLGPALASLADMPQTNRSYNSNHSSGSSGTGGSFGFNTLELCSSSTPPLMSHHQQHHARHTPDLADLTNKLKDSALPPQVVYPTFGYLSDATGSTTSSSNNTEVEDCHYVYIKRSPNCI